MNPRAADHARDVAAILQTDAARWHLLGLVRGLRLPDCWIGAGLVRSAVWDHLHGHTASPITGDVDVIWHDPDRLDPVEDRAHEAALLREQPAIRWSVKNQARMHLRNGDPVYGSAVDAMRYWSETATAVAARRHEDDSCEIAAPFGLDDLMGLIVRPTPRFEVEKRAVYEHRLRTKAWPIRWPRLREADRP